MLSERERSFAWRDGERLIRFGTRTVGEAPGLLEGEAFEGYALLTTRRALDASPGAGRLADDAGAVVEVPSGGVPEAAAAVRAEVGRRPLVALGGGRVIDSAKAIAAADGLSCAAVPTTLSGAEVTRIHRLPAGVERPLERLVRPALVVADPELMASQPRAALTASAMNALAHGAEALYAQGANPVGQLAALRGAELLATGLEASEPDRESVALGALLCSWAIDGAGLGLHHALCQTVVRVTGSPHAETNATMLPHVLRHVAPHAPRVLGRLAIALGAARPEADLAAARAKGLASATGVTRLAQLGVDESVLEEVVETVRKRPELATTPGRPGPDDLRNLLLEAL